MGWIWREKPDGTRAFAYPVYLGGALAVLGLISVIHRRLSPAVANAPLRAFGRGADVRAITGSAEKLAPVALPAGRLDAAARSFRLGGESRAAPRDPAAQSADAESFDPIHAALRGREETGERSGSGERFAALPPAFAGEEGSSGRAVLLGYRDPTADPAASGPAGTSVQAPSPWLPRGALIPVYLLTTVDTSNAAALLQFGLAQDVVRRGDCRLRFGYRLLGKLAGKPMRGRLALVANTVLYPDGRQGTIQATAVEADDSGANIRPGIAADFIPPPAWAQAAPYISDFATGFLGLLQSRAQQGFTVGVGGVSLASSLPADAKSPAYQASTQAISDFTAARLHEIEERYAAYYLIPAGTAFWLQLDAGFAGTPLPNDEK